MDVATWTSHVPISKRFVAFLTSVACLSIIAVASAPNALAANEIPLHWSADKTLWDRKNNIVTLTGHAALNKPKENVTADQITLDLNKRILRAKGNCVYMAGETIIHSDEMYFNIDTGLGSIIRGRVSSGQFLLVGQRINRLATNRYQTHRAEYTTCWDCPGSWSFEAEDLDLEIGGYAYLTNAVVKMSGSPFFWIPYLILPVKTSRQTGFLFPVLGVNPGGHGFMFVPQFFWATNRSTDMTFGLGTYSERGFRANWEGRYKFGDRSEGTVNLFYTYDAKSQAGTAGDKYYRYAMKAEQMQEFPLGIQQKLKLYFLSDSLYPTVFQDDVPGFEEAVLGSDLLFSKSTDIGSAYATARIYRNLLYFTNYNVTPRMFDPKTVQLFPQIDLRMNDFQLFNLPLYAGLTGGLSHFWRAGGYWDLDCEITSTGTVNNCPTPAPTPVAGQDAVRRAVRYYVNPSIYGTFRPFDTFSLLPSLTFYGYFYDFLNQVPNLTRGYLQAEVDLSMQLEKVFDTDYKNYKKVKHVIRPTLKYSVIPLKYEDETHPFMQQLALQQGFKFDNRDIVPFSKTPNIDSYFTPLGNSLTYGLVTQWMRRGVEPDPFSVPTSETFLEFTLGQSIDFTQFSEPEDERVPFSRFFLTKNLNVDRVSWSTAYYYYPYVVRLIPSSQNVEPSPHWFRSRLTYTFDRTLIDNVFAFERSAWIQYEFRNLTSAFSNLKFGTTFSISDYLKPGGAVEFDFWQSTRLQKVELFLTFQSPARCWQFTTKLSKDFVSTESYINFQFSLELNWTGSGYGKFAGLPGTGSQPATNSLIPLNDETPQPLPDENLIPGAGDPAGKLQ